MSLATLVAELRERAAQAEDTINYAFGQPTTFLYQDEAMDLINEIERLLSAVHDCPKCGHPHACHLVSPAESKT